MNHSLASLRAKLERIADMVDELGNAPLDEARQRLNRLELAVQSAKHECAELWVAEGRTAFLPERGRVAS